MSLVEKLQVNGHSVSTQNNPLQNLLDFLTELERHNIFFKLGRAREEAVMVEVAVPGERWEVEFLADGAVEIEVFNKSGGVKTGHDSETALKELFDKYSD